MLLGRGRTSCGLDGVLNPAEPLVGQLQVVVGIHADGARRQGWLTQCDVDGATQIRVPDAVPRLHPHDRTAQLLGQRSRVDLDVPAGRDVRHGQCDDHAGVTLPDLGYQIQGAGQP